MRLLQSIQARLNQNQPYRQTWKSWKLTNKKEQVIVSRILIH